jgi:hypothetical protein
MKIAIYQGDARVCGPSAWCEHMRTGLSRLGHEVHIVASTKSGKQPSHYGNVKPGGHWWMNGPDLCVRHDVLHNTFDNYDLVLLPEPKIPALDKDAKKKREAGDESAIPFYIEALSKTRTPFTTALHGNPYTDSNSPFAADCLALPNFTGTIIGHTAPLRTVSESISHYPQVDIPLPYTTRVDVEADYPVNRTVGVTGRFMFNKGSHILGLAGQYLPPDVTVEIWGSCSTGRGPSLTYNLYETLKPLCGKNYKRYHNSDGSHPKATEDGNIVQPFPYDLRPEGGALVRYLGNYTDAVEVCSRLMVHTNLTADRYTSGMEFSTMEALDAGSLCITQDNVSSDPAYRTLVMHGWNGPAGSVKTAFEKRPEETKQVAEKVMEVFDYFSTNPKVHEEVVRHNRQALRDNCAPELVAKRVLDECL